MVLSDWDSNVGDAPCRQHSCWNHYCSEADLHLQYCPLMLLICFCDGRSHGDGLVEIESDRRFWRVLQRFSIPASDARDKAEYLVPHKASTSISIWILIFFLEESLAWFLTHFSL